MSWVSWPMMLQGRDALLNSTCGSFDTQKNLYQVSEQGPAFTTTTPPAALPHALTHTLPSPASCAGGRQVHLHDRTPPHREGATGLPSSGASPLMALSVVLHVDQDLIATAHQAPIGLTFRADLDV